jgi:predicted nuclease of restriction endonuclease-like (RecB) superfamily
MPKKDYELVPSQGSLKTDKDYQDLLRELQSILSKGLHKAYKAVDNIKVQTYWQMGERIVREELKHQDRADYGQYIIDNLVVDLGVKRSLLYEIISFFRAYKNFHTVCGQLSWSHYGLLIKINEEKERLFYQNKAVIHSWSVRELEKQIKSQLYQETSPHEVEAIFQTKLTAVSPERVFNDAYNFDFIQLERHENEKDLENKILLNCPTFLKALGEDFAFLANQVPIKIGGETHFIDLVLYHRAIPCVILVELKSGKFESGHVGQVNKYVAYWRKYRQYEHEKNAIGLIICREADKEEVIFALDGLEEKIFVAEYKVKLPSEATIKKALREL